MAQEDWIRTNHQTDLAGLFNRRHFANGSMLIASRSVCYLRRDSHGLCIVFIFGFVTIQPTTGRQSGCVRSRMNKVYILELIEIQELIRSLR